MGHPVGPGGAADSGEDSDGDTAIDPSSSSAILQLQVCREELMPPTLLLVAFTLRWTRRIAPCQCATVHATAYNLNQPYATRSNEAT